MSIGISKLLEEIGTASGFISQAHCRYCGQERSKCQDDILADTERLDKLLQGVQEWQVKVQNYVGALTKYYGGVIRHLEEERAELTKKLESRDEY